MRTCCALLTLAMTVTLEAQNVRPERVLDLTTAVERKQDGPRSVTTCVSSSKPEWPVPLSLQLLPMAARQFRLSQHVTFEVALRNSGESPITIPWSAKWSDGDAEIIGDAAIGASLALVLAGPGGRSVVATSIPMFSSIGSPQSGMLLDPHEEVLIRARGVLALERRELVALLSTGATAAEARAQYTLKIGTCSRSLPVVSDPVVVDIRLPRQ